MSAAQLTRCPRAAVSVPRNWHGMNQLSRSCWRGLDELPTDTEIRLKVYWWQAICWLPGKFSLSKVHFRLMLIYTGCTDIGTDVTVGALLDGSIYHRFMRLHMSPKQKPRVYDNATD